MDNIHLLLLSRFLIAIYNKNRTMMNISALFTYIIIFEYNITCVGKSVICTPKMIMPIRLHNMIIQ